MYDRRPGHRADGQPRIGLRVSGAWCRFCAPAKTTLATPRPQSSPNNTNPTMLLRMRPLHGARERIRGPLQQRPLEQRDRLAPWARTGRKKRGDAMRFFQAGFAQSTLVTDTSRSLSCEATLERTALEFVDLWAVRDWLGAESVQPG
jgi:hypothetical protein